MPTYIKNIEILETDAMHAHPQSVKFFADGLPGIVFWQSGRPMFLNEPEKKLPQVFLYGQTVKPIELTAVDKYRMTIVYLYPHVIKSLFGVEASELTDTCLDIELLPVKEAKFLKEQLAEAASVHDQKTPLLNLLTKLLHRNDILPEKDLHYVTDNLIRAGGNVSLKTLQHELNITERTFERKFLRHVGVSPRLFARICRFHAALSQLRSGKPCTMADITYDNGFADQSHMGRTFKEFTGLTPTEYLLHYQMACENF